MTPFAQWMMIGALGFAGVLCRYGLDLALSSVAFPLSTFVINVTGSFAIGYISGGALITSQAVKLAVLTGFLGGFTTFSSYSLQTVTLLQQQQIGAAALYGALSPALGLLAAWAGLRAAALL
ncbi:MAG TPA: CrcB family protein [Bdellovibrionales bacterium]|nr:CrcB family protein [Bdellovibrionales bacterium]